MTAPEDGVAADTFLPAGRSTAALLVQPRPRRNPAYVVYGDEVGAPEVFVHARVMEDLRKATLDAMPYETIGALLGRPCHDDFGTYVVVENVITVGDDEHEASAAGVRISTQGRSSLRRRAAQHHPTLEPVGWWHSHPHGPARYSSVDRDQQRSDPRGHHVGIVVGADHLEARMAEAEVSRDPFGVYVGPSSALLARRSPQTRGVSGTPDATPAGTSAGSDGGGHRAPPAPAAAPAK